jgi:release factor glutamine methyltransferase
MSTFLQSYEFDGQVLELELSKAVFQPTLTSRALARSLPPVTGATVLDLGCGTGVLAILAALRGAEQVDAVDVMPQACELARSNARRNGVADRVNVTSGDLFESVAGRHYDIIISDVSGVADEVARLSPWYPETIPTGGRDGADHIVRLLHAAPAHLRPGGTLFFATGSISNVGRTLEAARESFGKNVELVQELSVPFCAEFNDNLETMTRMQSEGLVDFTVRRSRRLWTLQIYRAWL